MKHGVYYIAGKPLPRRFY